jgi:hypothetical protein
MPEKLNATFEQVAQQHAAKGVVFELWDFIWHNKIWWMIPIVIALLVFGLLILLSGTGIAPFIYTLF